MPILTDILDHDLLVRPSYRAGKKISRMTGKRDGMKMIRHLIESRFGQVPRLRRCAAPEPFGR